MQIIINIPEEIYQKIKETSRVISGRSSERIDSILFNAVNASTPLPKGHGDLIERSEAIKINELHHGQMPNHINHQIWNEINDAPTIIEADKESD